MELFKDTFVGKGSELEAAISSKVKGAAAKVYDATTARYEALYSADDRAFYKAHQGRAITQAKEARHGNVH
jgi:hypothetical protein